MYFVIVLGMLVLCNLCIRVCRLTVSKAFDMSRAIASVLCGGFCWLNPCVMVLFMVCSAVTVECLCLNPCWCAGGVMFCVMLGRSIFSRVFAMGDRRAIGL